MDETLSLDLLIYRLKKSKIISNNSNGDSELLIQFQSIFETT